MSRSVDEKAARCVVTPAPHLPGFIVTSSEQDGGHSHNVRLELEGAPSTARCDCTWAIKRPNGAPCSHLLAVYKFAATQLKSKPGCDFPDESAKLPEKDWNDGEGTEF